MDKAQPFVFNDYQVSDAQAFSDLEKAVTAEQVTGAQTWGSAYNGANLKYESLEKTIKKLTIKMESIKLYRDIPKKGIFNTVHEFVQETSFSTTRSAGLVEGEVPFANNSEYVRRAITTSYTGELRQITDIAQQVNTIAGNGNAQFEREVNNGVLSLTRRLNQLTAYGSKAVVPTEFDGFGALHSDLAYWSTLDNYMNQSCLVDLRNTYLTNDNLNDGVQALVEDGNGTGIDMRLYTSFGVIAKYTESLVNTFMVNVGQVGSQTANTGQRVKGFESAGGTVDFHWDTSLKKKVSRKITDPFTHVNAPVIPNTPTIAAVADPLTKFAGFNGTYFYAVASVNRFGESALFSLNAVVQAVLATEAVNLGWLDGGGTGLQATTGFVIYRSEVNPATTLPNTPLHPIFEVSLSQKTVGYDGGAVTLVRDRNRSIPNTQEAFLFQWDLDTIEFAELFGMRKVDLPLAYNGFMGRSTAIINYGMPLLYAPKRVIRYTNVKAV